MDKRIRRNEICVIGLPRCDFVFSSSRTCFIAYGTKTSELEKDILKDLLIGNGIEPIETGGILAPAQNAFCTKICSKIITSQFCIVLLNNDLEDNQEFPNANVNMEYGLMLGFNKYVIPFQKSSQQLPFNVAGLDTIKYVNNEFKNNAEGAIKQAINAVREEISQQVPFDQILNTFIIIKQALITPIDIQANKNIYDLGAPLGYYLLNDFAGMTYIFLGNFTALRPEVILWRVRTLNEILQKRHSQFNYFVKAKMLTQKQADMVLDLLRKTQVWLIVTSNDDKDKISKELKKKPIKFPIDIYSKEDVNSEVRSQPWS